MTITAINAADLLVECRKTLGLSVSQEPCVDDVLLTSLLRRSAGIHCPCSRATLRASLLESLQGLPGNGDSLPDRIDAAIEALIVGGDLLELNDVVTDDTAVKGTWVFAAPPSFVVRPSGGIFLLGIVPDQDSFLPLSLASRIIYDGFTRALAPQPGEDLAAELREQGLQQLSESAWLKSPKAEAAADVLGRFERRLATQPPAGALSDLEILDPARPVTYYRGRWTVPKNQSGTFVARRPQEFGAPIWCFVALQGGVPIRLLDLPLERTRWRGCDAAWHLQMAIDYCRHNPQRYRRRVEGDGIRLDFFSPLPQWSQRRLMIFGRAAPRQNSLFSYWLPPAEAQTEERFLQERLWLSRTEDSE
jgi:hypothetical protein